MHRSPRLLASCVLPLWAAIAPHGSLATEILYTFDNDDPRGPHADALGADGFQDAAWWYEGVPGVDREHPIFGKQSLVTKAPSPIELSAVGDLGPEVTFSAHVRKVEPGVNTLFSNWVGRPVDGGTFIAFDPASKYARDGIFLRFHHWRQTSKGLTSLELVIPPIADWSKDEQVHHLAVTYSHGVVTAYLDGKQLGQVKTEAKEFDHLDLRPARHSLLYGGAPSMNPYALIGTSDDVLILGRALTDDEIMVLCKKGAVGSGLVKADLERRATAKDPAELLSEAETRRLTMPVASGSAGTDSEWTFEAARQQWHPMIRPVQHVGVPGYQWQTAVFWDGSLVFGPFWRLEQAVAPLGNNLMHLSVAFGEPIRFMDRSGTNAPSIRRYLEGGRLPIPSVESRDGNLLWRETVFAHLLNRQPEEGMRPKPEDMLITHMCWKVRNTGLTVQTGHLWLYPADTSHVRFGYKCTVDEELGQALPHQFQAGLGIVEGRVRYAIPSPKKGTLLQRDETPLVEGLAKPLPGALEWKVELAPGEAAELCVILPYGAVDKATGEGLLKLDSASLLAEVRTFWKTLVYREGQITTPDPFVNDYLVAVAGQMSQQVAFRHYPAPGMWMYKTSPNHYENLWPCNEAKALPTFDFRGLPDINRKILQSFVDLSSDDVLGLDRTHMGTGSKLAGEGYARIKGFLGNFREWTANPLLISHGLGMWALAAHFRVTRDREWLGQGDGSPLQTMLDAFDWVAAQRKRTMREESGKKVEHWGLLPAASAHDWLAGSTIFNDAFCIYGMTEVVRMLGEIGHPRAAEMKRELNDYRECLRRDYAAARDRARPLPLPDGRALPYVPRVIQELNWSKIDWTYSGYSPLRAGAFGTLEPNDPLVDQALAFMEAGIPGGSLPTMGPPASPIIGEGNFLDVVDNNAPRHWLWRHYVEWETMWPIGGQLFLARDDLPRFFEWLFNNLAIVLHHDWRVGVESIDGVPSCAPGDGERWQLVRRMFINETGGWDGSQQELFLLQAIPRSWLRPGDRLSVRNMGTYFGGRIQLEAQVAQDSDSLQIDADVSLAVEPARIRMRLRSGDGRPLVAATIDGEAVPTQAGDVIMLPQRTTGHYRIVGEFRSR